MTKTYLIAEHTFAWSNNVFQLTTRCAHSHAKWTQTCVYASFAYSFRRWSVAADKNKWNLYDEHSFGCANNLHTHTAATILVFSFDFVFVAFGFVFVFDRRDKQENETERMGWALRRLLRQHQPACVRCDRIERKSAFQRFSAPLITEWIRRNSKFI